MGFFNRAAGGMMSAPGGLMGARGSGGLGSIMGQAMKQRARAKMMPPAPMVDPMTPAPGGPAFGAPPQLPPMPSAPPQLPPGLEHATGAPVNLEGAPPTRPPNMLRDAAMAGGGMSPIKGQMLQQLFARMQAGRR